ELHSIDLLIFDFHLAPAPLAKPEVLRDTMRWLADPDAYRKQYLSKAALTTNNFRVRPLSLKVRTYHHFWKNYSKNAWGEAPDPWSLQLPFFVEPLKGNWDLTGLPAGVQASVRPVVFLFAFGWSTHLEISLEGKMDASQWVDLLGNLKSNQLLRQDKKQFNLAGAFSEIASKLRNDLFANPAGANDSLKVPRHMVTSISRFKGPTRNYASEAQPAMPASDRACMHSCLLGRQVLTETVPAVEQ